jgi:hypothetical protein
LIRPLPPPHPSLSPYPCIREGAEEFIAIAFHATLDRNGLIPSFFPHAVLFFFFFFFFFFSSLLPLSHLADAPRLGISDANSRERRLLHSFFLISFFFNYYYPKTVEIHQMISMEIKDGGCNGLK